MGRTSTTADGGAGTQLKNPKRTEIIVGLRLSVTHFFLIPVSH
jgi:hypothetical protein